jgi:hypothetical protein
MRFRRLPESDSANYAAATISEKLNDRCLPVCVAPFSDGPLLKKLREYQQMGIQTILVLNPGGDDHYRFSAFGLTPLQETAFDRPGSSCRFDLDEIKKLLD